MPAETRNEWAIRAGELNVWGPHPDRAYAASTLARMRREGTTGAHRLERRTVVVSEWEPDDEHDPYARPPAIVPLPPATRVRDVPSGHSFTGWPLAGPCSACGAPAAILSSTWKRAEYECRGTPTEHWTVYGTDRCGSVFTVEREEGP